MASALVVTTLVTALGVAASRSTERPSPAAAAHAPPSPVEARPIEEVVPETLSAPPRPDPLTHEAVAERAADEGVDRVLADRAAEITDALHGIGLTVGERVDREDIVQAAHGLGLRVGHRVDVVDVERVVSVAEAQVMGMLAGAGLDPGTRVDDEDWRAFGTTVGVDPGDRVDFEDIVRISAAASRGGITAAPPPHAAAAPRRPAVPTAESPAPRPPAPRRLYLAVGHGRTPEGRWDVGAEGGGTNETVAGQVVVDEMVQVLRGRADLQVAAESGDHPNVVGSVARANAGRFDDCIAIHHDQVQAPTGAFAHWHPASGAAGALAERLVRGLEDIGLQRRDDWHRPRPRLYFVRRSECTAVLVEVGRIGEHGPERLREIGRALAGAYLAQLDG